MNIEKWKSVAVDKESYYVLTALGKLDFRSTGFMVSKLVKDYVDRYAKKKGKSATSTWKELREKGFQLKK